MNDNRSNEIFNISDDNQIEYDIYAGKILSFYLIINILNIFIKQTLETGIIVSLLTPVFGIMYLIYIIYLWKKIKKCFKTLLFWEVLFIVLIVVSMIMNRGIAGNIVRRCIWILAFCIPLSTIASKVKNKKLFIDQTSKANIIVFICVMASIGMSYKKFHSFSSSNYNMTIGYAGLFSLFFYLSKAREKNMYYFLALTEAILIIMGGSRGQLLCIVIFITLYLNRPLDTKKRIWAAILGFLGLMILVFLHNVIADLLLQIVDKFGSRTLKLLIQGRITYDSGRGEIWVDMIKHIQEKSFVGWGISGELNFMRSYPHNLFLELMMHYGVFIGGFSGIVIILIIVLTLFKRYSNDVLIILFSAGFIPLMLSGTYTQEPLFWIYMAMSFTTIFSLKQGKLKIKKH